MTAKQNRTSQKNFLRTCVASSQPLEDILDDLDIELDTFAAWLRNRDFRVKLHATVRYLRRTCDLQLEIGAAKAAATLARAATGTAKKGTVLDQTTHVARAACVDLIRLARDSRARKSGQHPPAAEMDKRRKLYHPDVPDEVARTLVEALTKTGEPDAS